MQLSPPKEPGEALVISGVVYKADRKTPAPGTRIYVYQTDREGWYSRPVSDNRNPRIKGWLTVAQDGRYEIQTIRPGSYPNSRNPQHIHIHLAAEGIPEHVIDEYQFADDPLLDSSRKAIADREGRWSHVVKLAKGADGVWRGQRDLVLDPALAARNPVQR